MRSTDGWEWWSWTYHNFAQAIKIGATWSRLDDATVTWYSIENPRSNWIVIIDEPTTVVAINPIFTSNGLRILMLRKTR